MRKSVGIALGAAAAASAWQIRRSLFVTEEDLTGQVALITGGSRGLGLQLARDLAAQGCRLAICARDTEELERARVDLQQRGAEVWTEQCDVTQRDQVENFILGAIEHFGALDIVVANAGIIQVGPVETMRIEDFQEAMNVMFWGVFYTIWSALPYMYHRRSGKIVTITSIGGKISVPHLLPYSCAKFAAVALSEGLAAELSPLGIKVLTVIPGLMRTGSHLNAEFKGQHDLEYAWFGLGATLPGMSMKIERASSQIIRAMRTGQSHQILTLPAQFAARFHGAFPALSSALMNLVNRILPDAEGGSHDRVRGFDAERKLDSALHRTLTALGRSAAERMNEVPTAG